MVRPADPLTVKLLTLAVPIVAVPDAVMDDVPKFVVVIETEFMVVVDTEVPVIAPVAIDPEFIFFATERPPKVEIEAVASVVELLSGVAEIVSILGVNSELPEIASLEVPESEIPIVPPK